MLWLRYAFVPEKVRAPAARLVELPPLVEGHAIAVGHVRLQPGLIGGQNARQLRADVLGCLLDRIQPRKFAALEELDRRELGNIEEGRLRCELFRSEEHTSELQSPCNLVCRLLLEKKKSVVKVRIELETFCDRR